MLLFAILAHIFVAYLVLVAPWVSRRKFRLLQEAVAAGIVDARERLYHVSVATQAVMVAVVGLLCLLGSVSPRAIGFNEPDQDAAASALGVIAVILVSGIFFRYWGDRYLKKMMKGVAFLLPRSTVERWWFGAVSVGAGVSEELVFRAFLLYYLGTFFPFLNLPARIFISAALFGFCHLYQGIRGILLTGVLGGVLAGLYVASQSLLVPVAIHAVLDLRILVIFSPRRLELLDPAPAQEGAQ